MTDSDSNQMPPIIFKQLENISDFHLRTSKHGKV